MGVLITPDGRLIINRQPVLSESFAIRYDIVNRRGDLEGVLILAEGEELLGFGKKDAYVREVDSNGVEWLRRHPWQFAGPKRE